MEVDLLTNAVRAGAGSVLKKVLIPFTIYRFGKDVYETRETCRGACPQITQ